MTELLLQKQPDRRDTYVRPPGIWHSPGRKRWMVTSPDLIREVMTSDAFAVPTYDVSRITSRLNIDLGLLNELRNWLPLAHEGERHKYLRANFARAITSRTEPALEALRQALGDRAALFNQAQGAEFCIFSELFRPAFRQAIGILADVDLPPDVAIEAIPQLFDDTISLSRRKRINAVLEVMSQRIPVTLSDEERQTRMAVIALSANTLLGSICQTFSERLRRFPGRPLRDIPWGRELVRTALPLVEKRVIRPVELGGQSLQPGDRVRLFIEAAGFTADGQYCYDELFFAVGPHKCVGMSFSIRAWQTVSDFLSSLDRTVTLLELRERQGDYVFNFPEAMMVSLDA